MVRLLTHPKFLLLVQTASIVKDIQTGRRKSAECTCRCLDISGDCLAGKDKDAVEFARMANEFVDYVYGDAAKPNWLVFWVS
jgi:hypothetical protein